MSRNGAKHYKYKNIALTLAVMLLVILAIMKSCTAEEQQTEVKADSKTSVNVPDVLKPVSSHVQPTSVILPFKAVGLEKNFRYLNVRNSETVGTGDLLLLNAGYRYDGKPGDLVSNYEYLFDKSGERIASASSTVNMASKRVLQAFNEMVCDFYKKTGKATILLTDLYLEGGGEGKTCYEHESGLAIDLRLYLEAEKSYPEFTGKGEYAWFEQNCHKYGFILRYSDDKKDITGVPGMANHFRYVGKPHAELIKRKAYCLEEYLDDIKQYTIDSPLSFEDENGDCWAIYYFAQSNEQTTNIPIPLDASNTEYVHSISGDNRDGYIVTVNIPRQQ